MVRCGTCGFYYVNPRPVLDEKAREHTYGESSSYHFDPVTKTEVVDPVLRARLDHEFSIIRRFSSPGSRMLEVGSGEGDFLLYANSASYRAQGVEYTPRFARYCKEVLKLEVAEGSLAGQHFPDAQFDIAVYIMVLEHTDSPRAEVEEVGRILKPGGILYLTVPNDGGLSSSLRRTVFKARESLGLGRSKIPDDPYWTPHHLFGFSVRCLRYLAGRSGFDVVHLRSCSTVGRHGRLASAILDQYHRLCQGSKLRAVLRKKSAT